MKYINIKKNNSGFVLLFAIMLSSIILAVSLGVLNISLKEIKFGTSAKDTNNAFFAADTGAECALFNDKFGGTSFPTPPTTSSGFVKCLGDPNIRLVGESPEWDFVLSALGVDGKGCARVKVIKDFTAVPVVSTTIISKGYNDGANIDDDTICEQGPNTVERQLEVNYHL